MPRIDDIRNRYLTMQMMAMLFLGASIASGMLCLTNLRSFEKLGEAPLWAGGFLIATFIAMFIALIYGKKTERANRLETMIVKLHDLLRGMSLTKSDLGQEGYITLREMAFQCTGCAEGEIHHRLANWQQQYLLTTQRERISLTSAQVKEALDTLVTIYAS